MPLYESREPLWPEEKQQVGVDELSRTPSAAEARQGAAPGKAGEGTKRSFAVLPVSPNPASGAAIKALQQR